MVVGKISCSLAIALAWSAPADCQVSQRTHLVQQQPLTVVKVAPNVLLADFGKVAFGNLLLKPMGKPKASDSLVVRFGEDLKDGRINRNPPGSVRYAEVTVAVQGGSVVVAPSADKRNTTSPAILTPPEWGVLIPFRWVEVEGWSGDLHGIQLLRRATFDSSWQDEVANFRSSDASLDQIWNLSHYSIKATTFAGIFVDGDRERIAYEADAYLNQLGYYAGNSNSAIPRATFDRLLRFPTWPSEWAPHMVFMAYADWMQTGDRDWLASHYEALKAKLLDDRVRSDGLVTSSPEQISRGDIVDWPENERDGYVFTEVNTVVNAFHLTALKRMSVLALALGRKEEATELAERESAAEKRFQEILFDPVRQLYRDGIGTDHYSLHANLFPLAFDLVPTDQTSKVAQWLAQRGMVGSVYAAQYLLEGLFENGQDAAAIRLMVGPGDRSWKHMVDSGTTISWEAWDQKYKPNQDWNHAWGAAPANILPKYVLGIQPSTPGWGRALIQPYMSGLRSAEGKIPTPRGEIFVSWVAKRGLHLKISIPPGMTAKIKLPVIPGSRGIDVGGQHADAHRDGNWWVLDQEIKGTSELVER